MKVKKSNLILFLFILFAFSADVIDLPLNSGVKDLSFLSDLEIEVVKELNLARTNPAGYTEYLKEYKKFYKGMYIVIPDRIDIITNEGVRAVDEVINVLLTYDSLPALKISEGLSLAAKDHVKDQSLSGRVGHSGGDGSSPFVRMNRYGFWEIIAGENIDYGNNIAREIVITLIIDDGASNRGHRKNIFNDKFNVVGIACGKHARYRYMCVMDFSGEYDEEDTPVFQMNIK